ncbi:MAG TPA: nicotinate-nucleotide adenylyltransferase [Rubricoccaceae bacterium]|nr:nicotinate-nucleotide adenylyltransferase [Rubricoccaceae bacterium]
MAAEAEGMATAAPLALFGGSFNPPHVAHLAVAEAAADAAGLDRVVWMPAATPPHKLADPALASAEDRLAMTRVATADNPRFEVSDLEIRRGEVSFTVDTLRALREAYPAADLVLILGGDSLAQFSTWRAPDEILRLARLVVYRRPGFDEAAVAAEVLARTRFVDAPLLDLSGTELRARLRAGRTVRYLVPDAVRDYIAARGLYGVGSGP